MQPTEASLPQINIYLQTESKENTMEILVDTTMKPYLHVLVRMKLNEKHIKI